MAHSPAALSTRPLIRSLSAILPVSYRRSWLLLLLKTHTECIASSIAVMVVVVINFYCGVPRRACVGI